LFSRVHVLIVVVLGLILLGHESKVEVGVSQFLHGALGKGIFGDFLLGVVELVDGLHGL
jgi:hypothetical protein